MKAARASLHMNVSPLIVAAFGQAAQKYPEIHRSWITASFRVGSLLPNSLLSMCIQRDGWLDMVLRCMEDELAAGSHAGAQGEYHFQNLLSELWIGSVYETLRLLKARKLMPDSGESLALLNDLSLIRMPLEKHEIAKDQALKNPLQMQAHPPNNERTDFYVYDKDDPTRAHIMPRGVSPRGSVMWQLLDVKANQERWVERRGLSDRLLSLWCANIQAPVA